MSRIHYDHEELVAEFEWTRVRHGGLVTAAAPIFGITPQGLERRLWRARKNGIPVEYKGIDMSERAPRRSM
jgi:hypothetical protein